MAYKCKWCADGVCEFNDENKCNGTLCECGECAYLAEFKYMADYIIMDGIPCDWDDVKQELVEEYDYSEEEADAIIKMAEALADHAAGHY
jgi:hypothetical protein